MMLKYYFKKEVLNFPKGVCAFCSIIFFGTCNVEEAAIFDKEIQERG